MDGKETSTKGEVSYKKKTEILYLFLIQSKHRSSGVSRRRDTSGSVSSDNNISPAPEKLVTFLRILYFT